MSATHIRRQLATYSLVSRQMGGSVDPIAAMKPFFAPIAADWHGQRFDPGMFRSELQSRYGLNLSGDVTEMFVQRLSSLGMLRRADKDKLEWVRAAATNDNGSAAEDKLNKLILDAKKIHEEKKDLLTEDFNEELFLSGLKSVLLNQNRPLSNAISAISGATGATETEAKTDKRHEYFAAEYVRWCSENDVSTFEWLSELAASTFVSEALIGIRTPSDGSQNKTYDLCVYLDTPFAMEFLGCSGYNAKEDARFIVDTLKSINVPVYILDHSVEELQGNLKAVLKSKPWERRGPTAAAIIHQEVTDDYLDDVRQNPQHYLGELGVKIVETGKQPHHICKDSFSDNDKHNFYAKIYNLHDNELARDRDASSIEWMMYRRKKFSTRDVLKSKHILLTRNRHLVRYAQDFTISDCGYQRGQAGPAIRARDLAGVLWLLMGQQERTELSQRQLLLSCDRARIAAPDVVAAMLEAVRGVNPKNADLIAAAMTRPTYLAIAMDAVANDGGQITEAAIESTLEAVRADLIADERTRAALEIEEQKQRSESEAVLQRLVNRSLSTERDELSRKLQDRADRLDAANNAAYRKLQRQYALIHRAAVLLVHLIVVSVAISAAVMGTDAFNLPWYVKAAVATIAALLGLYGTHKLPQSAIRNVIERLAYRSYKSQADRIFIAEAHPQYIDGPMLK